MATLFPGDLTRRRVLRLLASVPSSVLIGGCGAVLGAGGPPPLLFVLTPKSTFPDSLPTVDWQLLVEVPVAPASINAVRIALQRDPLQIEYYAGARWPDVAPLMVQTLIVESFENSKAISAVGRVSPDLRADFVLKPELREFQVEYFPGNVPRARVALLVRLVAMPSRTIVGFKRFEATHEAVENRLTEIVRAFDEALGAVLKQLVEWTLRTGEFAQRAS